MALQQTNRGNFAGGLRLGFRQYLHRSTADEYELVRIAQTSFNARFQPWGLAYRSNAALADVMPEISMVSRTAPLDTSH